MGKVEPFESEFSSDDVHVPTGDPMSNAMLDDLSSGAGRWILVEHARQLAVLDGVLGFYLAKYFSEEFADFDGWTNSVASSAANEMRARLWRLAVIDVAKVNDQTQLKRSASLPGVLQAMKEVLEASDSPSKAAELAMVNDLRTAVNADLQPSLRYIRHIRNKWAGHPSLDRLFDPWADAGDYLSIPLVEEGLVRLVRAHQDAANLINASPILKSELSVTRPGPETVQTQEGTVTRVAMAVEWSSVTVWARVARDMARRYASALRDQFVSPSGYGSPEDTDWSPGSRHAALRAAIDEQVAKGSLPDS